MRDVNRRELARAKSRRATPQELREAQQRLKEIEAELLQTELQQETLQGEEREKRYERVLRLRALREDFMQVYPVKEAQRPNTLLLAAVMTICSFFICAACSLTGIAFVAFLNQTPDPNAVTSTFWDDMQNQRYGDIHANLLYPATRAQKPQGTFITEAQQADKDYGPVTGATVQGKPEGDLKQTATYTYSVTRAKNVTYTVKLKLTTHNGQWGIQDLNGATNPVEAGVKPVTPTDTPAAPSPTATGFRNDGRLLG